MIHNRLKDRRIQRPQAQRRRRRGLTLIEAGVVLVAMLVFAGVTLPKYYGYASEAEASSVQATLGNVRAGIANFYANTAITGAPRYPTIKELRTLGAVLHVPLDENPYNNSNKVRDAAGTWNAKSPPCAGASG